VTLVAPLGLALLALAALRSPTGFAPYYFLAYLVWSGYHYSGQSLGVALLYPLRQGAPLSPVEKRLFAAPLYASWLFSLAGFFQPGAPGRNLVHVEVLGRLPGLRVDRLVLLATGVLTLATLAGPLWVGLRRRHLSSQTPPLPAASYGVLAAQLAWFGWGAFDPLFAALAVPALHSLQYLTITSFHALRPVAPPDRMATAVRYAVVVLGIGAVVAVGAAAVMRRTGVDPTLAAATVATFVNLHHFLLDGRIWRLRERRVREPFVDGATGSRAPLSGTASPAPR
jgi:hypothetical protein